MGYLMLSGTLGMHLCVMEGRRGGAGLDEVWDFQPRTCDLASSRLCQPQSQADKARLSTRRFQLPLSLLLPWRYAQVQTAATQPAPAQGEVGDWAFRAQRLSAVSLSHAFSLISAVTSISRVALFLLKRNLAFYRFFRTQQQRLGVKTPKTSCSSADGLY